MGLPYGVDHNCTPAARVPVIAWLTVVSALESTYRAVLFAYAQTGETGGFSQEALEGAFAPKEDLRDRH
jgi:hypothetical protein